MGHPFESLGTMINFIWCASSLSVAFSRRNRNLYTPRPKRLMWRRFFKKCLLCIWSFVASWPSSFPIHLLKLTLYLVGCKPDNGKKIRMVGSWEISTLTNSSSLEALLKSEKQLGLKLKQQSCPLHYSLLMAGWIELGIFSSKHCYLSNWSVPHLQLRSSFTESCSLNIGPGGDKKNITSKDSTI